MGSFDFLANTPLVRWYQEKQELTAEDLVRLAASRGLTLVPPQAINGRIYVVLYNGKVVREGPLNGLQWFLENYNKQDDGF